MLMDLKKEYEKLYQHWLSEFQQLDLTTLTQETLNDYKNNLDYVSNFEVDQKNKLEFQILESYKNNFSFLFNDFLQIRELKIVNSALALKEINLSNIIDAEKLLYQNLISSIKGYKKLKNISIQPELAIEGEKRFLEAIKTESNVPEPINLPNLNTVSFDNETIIKDKKEDFNYVLIRFLKKTPPLVGVDLINYGPFEKEDVTCLPFKNAIILLNEKFAEKIEL